MTKVVQYLQMKLGITSSYSTFALEALKDQCIDMGLFMSSSMKAAIHLGPNCLVNLEVYKNANFEEIQRLFNITQKLIMEHSEEILIMNTIEKRISFVDEINIGS